DHFMRRFAGFENCRLGTECEALALGEDRWAGRRVADCFDAMTVRVRHERAVVFGVIVRPQSRRATVSTSTCEGRGVKGIDRGPVGSAKTDMRARDRRLHASFAGDGEFDAKRSRCSTVVPASPLAEINDAYEP